MASMTASGESILLPRVAVPPMSVSNLEAMLKTGTTVMDPVRTRRSRMKYWVGSDDLLLTVPLSSFETVTRERKEGRWHENGATMTGKMHQKDIQLKTGIYT